MSEYDHAFDQETRNLSALAIQGKLALPLFRDEVIERAVNAVQGGQSFLISAPPGVGKTCVLYGVARELAHKGRQLRELSTSVFMTNTKYTGEWQTKAQAIVKAGRKARAVLFISDIWNLSTTGVSSNDQTAVWDLLRNDVVAHKLMLAGEVTPERYEAMQRVPGFSELFELIPILPLTDEQSRAAVQHAARNSGIDLTSPQLKRIFQLCNGFRSRVPGPGPALEMVQRIKEYRTEKQLIGEDAAIDDAFIEKVFSIYSGLPMFVISHSVVKPASEIRAWFRERVIGQEHAIEAVTETIALYKAGIRDPGQPIGTFLFVGPTGVGKTELAKMLARFLFGSEHRLLRFDLSEYKDYHSYQMLVGNPDNPTVPARLVDPVRGQPFQVILFDEIEKAHPNVWDLLLQLLDEGRLTPASGNTTDFRNTIIIATSNVGSETLSRSSIGFQSQVASEISIQTLEQFFRPEILNRFQHIVSFRPLTRQHLLKIAQTDIKRILQRDGIADRNLAIELDEAVTEAIVDTGFDSRYGARALKRSVQRNVALPIANFLIENQVVPGSVLLLKLQGNRVAVRALETDDSRHHFARQLEHESEKKRRLEKAELLQRARDLEMQLTTLSSALNRETLEKSLQELDQSKELPGFWDDNARALEVVMAAERISDNLQRLYDLEYLLADLNKVLQQEPAQRELRVISEHLDRNQERLAKTRRELLLFGDKKDVAALLVISPIGDKGDARDFLYHVYTRWAKDDAREYSLLSQPQDDNDSVVLLIQGPYAFGYLELENGIHRVRCDKESTSSARIVVAPYRGDYVDVVFGYQKALKQKGLYGYRIRSQVRVEGKPGFSLKNERTINENRDCARRVAAALNQAKNTDEVVRRYDIQPFAVKDYLTEQSFFRKSDLKGHCFQKLLNTRVERVLLKG